MMHLIDNLKNENKFQNNISELIENNFNVMFLPLFQIFKDEYFLKYPYPNYAQNKTIHKEDIAYTRFDTELYFKCIKEGKLVVVEIQNKGSLIFTNHLVSDIFEILQRHYSKVKSYVFKGNNTGGYFKILGKAKNLKDMLPDFNKENVLDLFD